ncbi:MAG TPA: LexA family transcriptional regulator [Candidatus Kapabacteria bacterium]|jgi:SOS-response transcriptional repressor LexA
MENLGNSLKNARKKMSLTQEDAAKTAEVSVRAWQEWERGNTEPSISALEKFADVTGINLFTLLTGVETIPIPAGREIPIVDRIPAGPLTQGFGEGGIIGSVQADIDDENAFGLIVSGVSMWPEIDEEDIVLCSPKEPFVNGKIYAAVTGEGEQSLKRVRYEKRSRAYALIPSNKEFLTVYVPEEQIIKLVRVVEIRRNLQ